MKGTTCQRSKKLIDLLSEFIVTTTCFVSVSIRGSSSFNEVMDITRQVNPLDSLHGRAGV